MIWAICVPNLVQFCPANSEISISFCFDLFGSRDLDLEGHAVSYHIERILSMACTCTPNMVNLACRGREINACKEMQTNTHKHTDKHCIFADFGIFFLRDGLTDYAEILQSETRDDLLWRSIFIFALAPLSPELQARENPGFEFSKTAFFTDFANFFVSDGMPDFAEFARGDTRDDLL